MKLLQAVTDGKFELSQREKQAPSKTGKEMFDRTLELHNKELDCEDYAYLSVFVESLISLKKREITTDTDFLRLGLLAHSLNDCAVSSS